MAPWVDGSYYNQPELKDDDRPRIDRGRALIVLGLMLVIIAGTAFLTYYLACGAAG